MQHTVSQEIPCQGIGLHSGAVVNMTIRPGLADSGIIFLRTDVTDRDNIIPALWDRVVDTRLCTMIGNGAGVSVGTIEHLMSALRGCGVDNAVIALDGPEVPVMDGSAAPFVELIAATGIKAQRRAQHVIRILKEVSVGENGKIARLSPADASVFGGEIAFDHHAIGSQTFQTTLVNGNFAHDIAQARTFGFLHEVEWMQKNGLARGGSLDNAIVLNENGVLNPEGLRFDDEFIRHKLLDAIGDLYLAGAPIIGAYHGVKAGHALNNALLHKLFATRGAWTMTERAAAFVPPAAVSAERAAQA